MNDSDERCINPDRPVGIDKACLSIINNQDVMAEVFTYVNECRACNGLPLANLSPHSNTTLVIPTRWEMHMYYVARNYQWCHGAYRFVEHGHYGWNLTYERCSGYYTIKEPTNPYMPILAVFYFVVATSILYNVCNALIPCVIKTIKERTTTVQDDMEDLQEPEPPPPVVVVSSRFSTRIQSIDTFRG